jgi:hypothetical protein
VDRSSQLDEEQSDWHYRFLCPTHSRKLNIPLSGLLSDVSHKIYRCWRVWNRAIWVAVVPALLALIALRTFLPKQVASSLPNDFPSSWDVRYH